MQKAFLILKTGGWCGISIFLSYLAITLIYVSAGELKGGIENKLLLISTNEISWWWILILSVLTDLLLLPFVYALYKLLFPLEKDIVLFAVLTFMLFIIMDLALTWPSFELLIDIAKEYVNAPEQTTNTDLLSMAELLDKFHSSLLFSAYVILFMSIGIVIFSRAFKKHLNYSGIYITGLLIGLLGISALLSVLVIGTTGIIAILVSVLTTLWIGMVSLKLLKLSKGAKAIIKR